MLRPQPGSLETYMGMRYQGGNRGMGFLYDDDGLVLT